MKQPVSETKVDRTKARGAAALVALALVASLLAGPVSAGTIEDVASVNVQIGEELRKSQAFLSDVSGPAPPLPLNPQQAVIDATSALSTELGFSQDPTTEFLLAALPDEVAGRIANVLSVMLTCHRITQTHFEEIRDRLAAIAEDGDGERVEDYLDIRQCAEDLWAAASWLEISLQTNAELLSPPPDDPLAGAPEINVWPVIKLERHHNTVYLHDYLLIIDLGGHDKYINNVGSNMVDVKFGPEGSVAPNKGPARGCQMAIPGLVAADCVPTVAVLIDMCNKDTYGVKQTPDVDAKCTPDDVIRRMVTGAVGFLGVGILIDSGPEGDKYTGKTVSLGAGHIFGVGMLVDRGGNDHYFAVRNSQGFALLGGVGILRDEGGSDKYDFYLPQPLVPGTPNEQDKAGGVVDDVGACDNRLRFLQGAGSVLHGTVGILQDNGGKDSYRGGFSDDFQAPVIDQTSGVEKNLRRGGSQGFGNNGGIGILIDHGGTDSYTIVNQVGSQGSPARGNGVTIGPDATCNNSTCSGGVFIDRGG